MWIEELDNGKFKYFERYIDPYTEKYKRISVTLDSKSAQAKKRATTILNDKISERLLTKKTTDITFKELYEEWFEYYKQHVKRTSWTKVPKMMKHVNSVIKDDVLARNIDEQLIQEIVEGMYTFGKLSLNYTKQTKTSLSVMLNYAVDRKYIEINPAMKVKITPKKAEEEKRRLDQGEKFLEANEMELLLKHLYGTRTRVFHGYIVEFLYLTGLRYGELQALQVKDFSDGKISVNGTLDYTYTTMKQAVKTTTKNISSNRSVDLPNRAIEILNLVIADNKLKFDSYTAEDYIFISNARTPLTIHSFNALLKRASDEIGIKKNVTSHIFRHSHVSLLSELNVPLKAIMERVGHSDANTTLAIYNHVTQQSKKNVLDKLNSI